MVETLIEQLKAGTAPWQKPWDPGDPNVHLPMNPATGRRYRGINVLYLMAQGRSDSRWMTYRQAAAMGAQVRRGEKGTPVQYWKFREEQDLLDDKGRPVFDAQGKRVKETVILERPRVFFATVFNAEQIDGLPPLPPRNEQSWDAVERADNLLKASGARITHAAGNLAFYRPSSDSITLPERGQFDSAERYYVKALHELGHWTGHASRLDRDLANPFGSEGYAREELRAEIASMILGDELGIGHDPGQHAAYVGSWIRVLRDDPLEVFRAAADAEKIHGYVMAFEHQRVQVEHREPMMHVNKQPETHMTSHETDRQYICVPFKENGEAKQLGARWDRKQRSWYVPAGMDMSLFGKWVHEPAAIAGDQPVHEGRQYLAVPYEERNAAKSAGALWDKAAKSWYVGPHADMEKLERWRPENITAEQAPSMSPREEFADAMRSLGFLVEREHPVMDGNRHRMRVEGDKPGNVSGFYVGHLDGHHAGYIKNNRTGEEMRWKAKGYVMDPAEKARLQAEAASKLAERERILRDVQEATAQRVSRQLSQLSAMKEPSPYLVMKGVAFIQ